ncbi:MAG: cyclic-di-AMP receptor [Bacillota bacterium]|nr:cyclic-di-AMP receptor [Bacillota bacterium]
MKLILAVINNDDSAIVTSALTKEGFFVTSLATTGGFLMAGNRTLLIGTEDENVNKIKEIIAGHCSTRKQKNPGSQPLGGGLVNGSLPEEVTVGGATYFVLDVNEFGKV